MSLCLHFYGYQGNECQEPYVSIAPEHFLNQAAGPKQDPNKVSFTFQVLHYQCFKCCSVHWDFMCEDFLCNFRPSVNWTCLPNTADLFENFKLRQAACFRDSSLKETLILACRFLSPRTVCEADIHSLFNLTRLQVGTHTTYSMSSGTDLEVQAESPK